MLSMIIYGRNDSHGYNLHKRVAISLNAMSEVMTDPDDEIVFVDYNTPDDLPTFAEAIQDTLTLTAKKRTRVLRVRPHQHRAFARRTHLVALEPISRNVALRRSNPANRWMLSTNTDMIFVPNRAKDSLTDIVGGLEDGFYHLPRFELPECLWEAFDRKDGKGIIRQVREWSKRYHLNEIVYGHHDNLYDAPGDFQLALRTDLFKIHGFHEEMILGWHVDSNLARRMRLLRGEVRTVIDQMTGYHCDHTRQATLMHRRDRVQNDSTRFIENVIAPEVPAQAETWGLPDETIEEINLTRGVSVRYIEALEEALPPGPSDFYECRYTPDSYNELAYPAEHVLPYVADLLSCAPIGATIAYAGVRADTFDMLRRAMSTMDPRSQLLVPETFTWLKGALRVGDSAWLNDADIYIFEIGEESGKDAPSTGAGFRTSKVLSIFKSFVDVEEDRQVEMRMPPRRVLAVNAIHNFFDQVVSDSISHTTTPYSSRTRHGYVVPERLPKTEPSAQIDLQKAGEQLSYLLSRSYQTPANELRYLLQLANSIPVGGPYDSPEWGRALALADPMLALLGDKRLSVFVKRSDAEIAMLIDELKARRSSVKLAKRIMGIDIRSGPSRSPARLANIEDWERPGWLRWAKRYFGGRRVYEWQQRSVWTWERVSLLEVLDQAFGFSSGDFALPPRILVVAHASEYLAACLIDAGATVDFVDPLYLLEEGDSADWRGELSWIPMKLREPIGSYADRVATGAKPLYDAVVCPQNSLMIRGRSGFGELMERIDALLKPGGKFVMACQVQLGKEVDEVSLPRPLILDGAFALDFASATGYRPLADAEIFISPRTLDLTHEHGQTLDGVQPFIHGWSGAITTAIWGWTRTVDSRTDKKRLRRLLEQTSRAVVEPETAPFVAEALEPAEAAGSLMAAVAAAAHPVEASGHALAVADRIASLPVAHDRANGAIEPSGNGHAPEEDVQSPGSRSGVAFGGSALQRLRSAPIARRTPRSIHIDRSRAAGVFAQGQLAKVPPGDYEIVYEVRARNSLNPSADALTVEVRHDGRLVLAETLTTEMLERRGRCASIVYVADEDGRRTVGSLEITFLHHAVADIDLLQLILY